MARQRRQQQTSSDGDRARTKRMVFERVTIGAGVDGEGEPEYAWAECGVFEGTKVQAIEAFAGKPGTPNAKVGVFKAPPARGWTGGVEYVQPALPLVERKVIS